MNSIFLSYSKQDYFFAEMLALKLAESGFSLWRDQGSIRAGDDWRQSIEDGIGECLAVVVGLSANSCDSAYVTYEWAYAIGMGKPVIPVKLSECQLHPKLEPTQYIDFSYPKALPWESLIERLREIEVEKDSGAPEGKRKKVVPASSDLDEKANAILSYLDSRGYQRASFERLRDKVDPNITDRMFEELIANRPTVFRRASIKGGKPGIAKRLP